MQVDDSNLAVGLRVQRGADWRYSNQERLDLMMSVTTGADSEK